MQVSSTAFLSLLLATFACIGAVLAIVMGRLGYSWFGWGLLGLLLGPIGLLLAVLVAVGRGGPGLAAQAGRTRPGEADGRPRAQADGGATRHHPGHRRRRGWL